VLSAIELALAARGLDAAALDAAEDAGLIALRDERLTFRHPLVRSAVYHAARAANRRAAHLALAEAFTALGDTQRRAWHLAIAATGPDETVAQALEEAAEEARLRTGYYAAAVAFERAAELSPDDEACARRLFAAAEHLELAGSTGRTVDLLDRALGRTRDTLLRADIHHLRAQINLRHRGAPGAASERLRLEAERIEDVAPAKAALLLVDAWLACKLSGDREAALDTAGRAHELGRRAGGRAELLGAMCLGDALISRGESVRGSPLLRHGLTLLGDGELLGRAHLAVQQAGLTLIRIEEYAQARVVLERSLEEARALSAVGILPFALAFLAELDFRTGRWSAAYAGACEALRLSEEAGEVVEWASLRCLAQIEAAQGRDADARAHASRGLELTAELGLSADRLHAALGLLELGRGRPEEAIAQLVRVGASNAAAPPVVPSLPDLVEACVRVGRDAEARTYLERFSADAAATGRVWALAAAARCRGLLAGEREFEHEFASALELHAGTPAVFEQARTELCLGERLRRSRRRVEARTLVRSALEAFERLGAEPWADRARSELTASGETARRGASANSAELTPQELQIAELVARGATNREVGSALFLSAKTIETHLSRIYRKLEIRSRTELARVLPADREGSP
jgi:DNA-binding CsgD family transcriptional regulator/tetratricopeptide (TPR) repeat protein